MASPINVVMFTQALLSAAKVSVELNALISKAISEGRDGISLVDLMPLKTDNDQMENEVIDSL